MMARVRPLASLLTRMKLPPDIGVDHCRYTANEELFAEAEDDVVADRAVLGVSTIATSRQTDHLTQGVRVQPGMPNSADKRTEIVLFPVPAKPPRTINVDQFAHPLRAIVMISGLVAVSGAPVQSPN